MPTPPHPKNLCGITGYGAWCLGVCGGSECLLGSVALGGDFGHPAGNDVGVGSSFERGPAFGDPVVAVPGYLLFEVTGKMGPQTLCGMLGR